MMMTKIRLIGIVFLLCIVQFAYGQKSVEKQVKKAFDNYKKEILNDRGEEAAKYVDSRTIKYYGDMLDLVKTADSAKVETLSTLDKLMVLSIRHRTPKEDILSFDGKSLLVYAINNGMVGKNSVVNNTIGNVTIEDNFAKGQFLFNKQITPFYFHFYNEQGQWKIDLTSLFPVSAMAFDKMIEESGENQNDFLLSLLEMLTGRKPDAEIWKPIN